MPSRLAHFVALMRNLVHPAQPDDSGSNTTETVIWIAILAAVALGVGAYFAGRIWEAAQAVTFQ